MYEVLNRRRLWFGEPFSLPGAGPAGGSSEPVASHSMDSLRQRPQSRKLRPATQSRGSAEKPSHAFLLSTTLSIDGRFRARGAAGFGPPPSANRCRNRGRRTQTSGSEANARPECRRGEPLDDRLPDAMLPETVGRCGIATRNTGEFRNAGIKVVDHWTGS